jgi:hypothetical protein
VVMRGMYMMLQGRLEVLGVAVLFHKCVNDAGRPSAPFMAASYSRALPSSVHQMWIPPVSCTYS